MKKATAVLLCLLMLAGIMTGCGNPAPDQNKLSIVYSPDFRPFL